ncbi:mechanosensitive ion channel family protein [Asticcacaulis sp. AC466]|uniref:mechanosensitive ion channel family protein n=1 Tax=Asticcacaulis sp. AC466 TaxID=1282362 RepID=UPI0004027805|nr:mechanosensitive ion channel family protein [Asticcacaulis sp. AC466]
MTDEITNPVKKADRGLMIVTLLSASAVATSAAAPTRIASELTLSERLISGFDGLWRHLNTLTPQALALNIGMSVAVAGVCWLLVWGSRAGLFSLLSRAPGHDGEAGRASIQKALRLTRSIIVFVFVLAAIVMIGGIWGVDVFALMSASLATRLTHTLVTLLIVLVITAVAFETAGVFIGYFLTRLKARKSLDLRRVAQIDTLGPIIRRTLQAAILVVGVMTFLSQLGVEIAPLLAGAGVVGIAIGFGAQTLVKDFFTGFFLLIEDVVAVGDTVTIAGSTGEVENMTLRYISLRGGDGTLHVFPYGEAQIIHNTTKTFARYVLDLPIALNSDIDQAIAVIKAVGADLKADAVFGSLILEPVEVLGVDRLADFGATVRIRIMTTPHERIKVGREFNRRLKVALGDAQIAISHKGAYAP